MAYRRFSTTIPAEVMADIQAEAARLDRTHSWLLVQAWQLARADIAAMRPQHHYWAEDSRETAEWRDSAMAEWDAVMSRVNK